MTDVLQLRDSYKALAASLRATIVRVLEQDEVSSFGNENTSSGSCRYLLS